MPVAGIKIKIKSSRLQIRVDLVFGGGRCGGNSNETSEKSLISCTVAASVLCSDVEFSFIALFVWDCVCALLARVNAPRGGQHAVAKPGPEPGSLFVSTGK